MRESKSRSKHGQMCADFGDDSNFLREVLSMYVSSWYDYFAVMVPLNYSHLFVLVHNIFSL